MSVALIENPVPESVRQELATIPDFCARARTIIVTDPSSEAEAASIVRNLATRTKELTDRRLAITRPMDAAKKSVMDLFAPPLAELETARACADRQILGYRREMQRRLDEENRRLAEIAERERREREEAAAVLRAKAEECTTEGRAAYLESLAEAQEAKAASVMPAQVYAPSKPSGLGLRGNWSAEVVDLMALVKAVAAGAQPITLLQANESVLNQMARALKDGLSIPGVRAVNNQSTSARRV